MKVMIEKCPNYKKVSSRQVLRPEMKQNYSEKITYTLCPECTIKVPPRTLELLNAIYGGK